MSGIKAKITSVGVFVPDNPVINEEIIELFNVETTHEWIVKNIGIKQRYICDTGETSAYMGVKAAEQAIEKAGLKRSSIDMLIVATTTPDMISPSTACIIKKDLNLSNAVAFDVSAVCSGFLFGMSIAEKYIISGDYNNILVIGSDCFSTITDWSHKHSVFFGDGAGAVIMQPTVNNGFLGFSLFSNSENMFGFHCNNGQTFKMDARQVYDSAVKFLPLAINGVLKKTCLSINDIKYILPHQPSKKILNEVGNVLGCNEKILMNMEYYGNTVSATIPILLNEVFKNLNKGDLILFAAIGSGWTYGAAIYEV